MSKRSILAALMMVLSTSGFTCRSQLPGAFEETDRFRELGQLAEWMTGSFSSAAQASKDDAYFDIRLEMVRVWADYPRDIWLYVEQAAADALDRPYRQRVYRLTAENDGAFRSAVFTLPDPARYVGAWRRDNALSDLSPEDLPLRAGCDVVLRRSGVQSFEGSTEGADCASSLRGAEYATSRVRITSRLIESWDQGFDGDGEQVWGAMEGPYVFRRQ